MILRTASLWSRRSEEARSRKAALASKEGTLNFYSFMLLMAVIMQFSIAMLVVVRGDDGKYAWRMEKVPPDFANASAANNSRGSSCRGARRMNSRAASMSLSRCTLYTWHMQTSKFT